MKRESTKELMPIFAVVKGDMVTSGPFPNKRLAIADCYEGEEVIEILPEDDGYEEFKSYMR